MHVQIKNSLAHLQDIIPTMASIYYIKLKSRPSVRPSVCLHFWHADISVVSALIEMGLA